MERRAAGPAAGWPLYARQAALLAVAVLTCCASPAVGEPASRYELFVLGRAQDGGLPHVGCGRETCCAAARRSGRIETPACLGIHDRRTGQLALIEATPAIERQIALLHELAGASASGPRRQPVDAVLVTHAHIGHYLGLAQFGREVASTDRLPVHCTGRMAEFLRSHGPWKQLVELGQIEPRPIDAGGRFRLFDGLEVEAIAVPHRDEFSDTVAFRIRGPSRTVLFCPDVDAWGRHEGLLERLLDGVDVAYVDATFYDGRELPERSRAEIPHPPMVDTMQRLGALAREQPRRLRFIHLNHTNPAFNDPEVEAAVADRGFRLAVVGERVEL